jgi:hypothetical protein
MNSVRGSGASLIMNQLIGTMIADGMASTRQTCKMRECTREDHGEGSVWTGQTSLKESVHPKVPWYSFPFIPSPTSTYL